MLTTNQYCVPDMALAGRTVHVAPVVVVKERRLLRVLLGLDTECFLKARELHFDLHIAPPNTTG